MSEQRFIPALASLGWVLPHAKREFGQMPDKALDFLVARCWGGVGWLVPGRNLCWAPKGCRGTGCCGQTIWDNCQGKMSG